MKQEACSGFDRYQAKFIPRCNCVPCWFKYFEVNEAKTNTAKLALEKFGDSTVEKVQGKKYLGFLKLFLQEKYGNTAH